LIKLVNDSKLFQVSNHEVLLEKSFETYQLDKQPTGWFFASAGKRYDEKKGCQLVF